MIEGQIVGDAAILAGKFIAKEKIESCEGRVFGWLHILLQRDDRRNLHGPAWAVDFPFIAGDDIHTFSKNRLNSGLPRPDTQRVITQGSVIGIEKECRANRSEGRSVGKK